VSNDASLVKERLGSGLRATLLVMAMAALVVRVVTIAEPLGIDQSLWASAVRGLARGQRLYRDVWEQRPPGIYLTYWFGFAAFGWTAAAVAWLDLLASALTAIQIYVLARVLATRTTAAVAVFLYAALTIPAGLFNYGGFLQRSVCETFIVASAGFAALSALAVRRRGSLAGAAGIGWWGGVAAIYKPNAVLYLPALLWWALPAFRGADRLRWARLVLVCAAASLVPPLLTILWLWHVGVLPDARIAVVDFNRWYVAAGNSPGAFLLAFSKEVWLRMKSDPLWLAGGVAAAAAVWDLVRGRRLPALASLAVLWGAACALVIAVNGIRLFSTYFLQAAAPLALLAAWWLTTAASGARGRRAVWALTLVAMGIVVVRQPYVSRAVGSLMLDARMLRGSVARQVYLDAFGGYANDRGYSARANEELADYVRRHTDPSDRIFLFGINGAGVYFAADRLTAHRFLRVNFFVPTDFPDPAFTLSAVVAELSVRRPRYLIFETLHTDSAMGHAVDALQDAPIVRSLLAAYQYDGQIEDFTLYRRR
jgi:Dolichyl-phosphate-mannose-protein mannosyltransferase